MKKWYDLHILYRLGLYTGLLPVLFTILLGNCIYFFIFHGLKSTLDQYSIAQTAANDLFIGFLAGMVFTSSSFTAFHSTLRHCDTYNGWEAKQLGKDEYLRMGICCCSYYFLNPRVYVRALVFLGRTKASILDE